MRILLISDIHSNRCALQAVLDKFGSADEIWCLGDVVECGPCPSECIDLVRRSCRHVIRGNHDVDFGMLRDSVSPEDIEYLCRLPLQLSVAVNGSSYFLIHRSPPGCPVMWPHSELSVLREAAASVEEDHVLCAHTHMAMIAEAAGKLIVNTGTIGQPRDGDYRAQCMLLEDGAFRHERVEYDLDEMEDDYRRAGLAGNVWIRYTRRGIVDDHGVQAGPFSPPPTDRPVL